MHLHFNIKEIRKSLINQQTSINCDTLFSLLLAARQNKCSFSCSISPLPIANRKEQQLENGLVTGHAYICTKLVELHISGVIHRLIRLYNPWGCYAILIATIYISYILLI